MSLFQNLSDYRRQISVPSPDLDRSWRATLDQFSCLTKVSKCPVFAASALSCGGFYWVQTCKVLPSRSFQRELRTQTSSSKNTNFRDCNILQSHEATNRFKVFAAVPDQELLWWFLTEAHFKKLVSESGTCISRSSASPSFKATSPDLAAIGICVPWCLSSMIVLDFQIALLLRRSWRPTKVLKMEGYTESWKFGPSPATSSLQEISRFAFHRNVGSWDCCPRREIAQGTWCHLIWS